MNEYASTFVVGLKDIVEEMLEKLFPNIKILLLLDGLVIYQGNISEIEVKDLRFFNNSFIVLRIFEEFRNNPIREMLVTIAKDKHLRKTIYSKIKTTKTGRTFRLVASNKNEFVTIDKSLRHTIENKISNITSLKVNRSKPHTEFWFLYRSEGYGFFLMRFTSHTAYEKILEKGELKPELSHLLCFISEPNESDIFLDPFCGYGSIPIERALSFPFNMIFATDKDPDKKKFVRNKLKSIKIKNSFIVKIQNALDLESFEPNFIHKIVTDPPWGLFEKLGMDTHDFYFLMLKEFYRVLKKNGILVILTAKKNEFESAISNLHFEEKLRLLNKYDVLVSGEKAAIYKIGKISR